MVTRKARRVKEDALRPENEEAQMLDIPMGQPTRPPAKAQHVEPTEIIQALNDAVSGVNAVFQLRDGLLAELAELKGELGVAQDVRVEQSRIDELKRAQEEFQYDYGVRKARMEQELERFEEERREKIQKMEDEARGKLKVDADEHASRIKAQLQEHALKIKTDRDDHDRKMSIERDDFERARLLFDEERAVFDARLKSFEEEKAAVRERLVQELNRDNEHQLKVAALNHQREVEILRSQLKLEQANAGKFEGLLGESRAQNDKFAEQLSSLSREALASAGSSAMVVNLKDIIAQMNPQGPASRA